MAKSTEEAARKSPQHCGANQVPGVWPRNHGTHKNHKHKPSENKVKDTENTNLVTANFVSVGHPNCEGPRERSMEPNAKE